MARSGSGYCRRCGKRVLTIKDEPNHILHFLITFLTCGFWVIVWIALAMNSSGSSARCARCGSPAR